MRQRYFMVALRLVCGSDLTPVVERDGPKSTGAGRLREDPKKNPRNGRKRLKRRIEQCFCLIRPFSRFRSFHGFGSAGQTDVEALRGPRSASRTGGHRNSHLAGTYGELSTVSQ